MLRPSNRLISPQPKRRHVGEEGSGNHLLTQVNNNQPRLRRRFELGIVGRKPMGSDATKAAGRNRWETRALQVFLMSRRSGILSRYGKASTVDKKVHDGLATM
jgi:hypothetical protein